MDKPHTIKPEKPVRRGQPKISVLGLCDRVDKCGWKPFLVRPHGMRVLGERLVGIRYGGERQREDTVRSGVEEMYAKENRIGTRLILPRVPKRKRYSSPFTCIPGWPRNR
jgi:hypothetical protein